MGAYLVSVGGWPILLIGLLSIAAGWGYTGGPLPIAYTPLGELFCVIFFGLGGVVGTYFLSTGQISFPAIVAGLAIGSLVAAVLLVNNHRDVVSDARVGRRTLPIVVGPALTVAIFAGLMLLPFALLPLIGRLLAAWTGMACTDRAAARTRDDLPICPGTARSGVQSNSCSDRSGGVRLQRIARAWSGPMTGSG